MRAVVARHANRVPVDEIVGGDEGGAGPLGERAHVRGHGPSREGPAAVARRMDLALVAAVAAAVARGDQQRPIAADEERGHVPAELQCHAGGLASVASDDQPVARVIALMAQIHGALVVGGDGGDAEPAGACLGREVEELKGAAAVVGAAEEGVLAALRVA